MRGRTADAKSLLAPRRLIERYNAEGPHKGVRTYAYIKPRKNGEATIEIWASAYSSNKGHPLMAKCIARMRTDSTRYKVKDTIAYWSWSSACQDHLIVDFHENGGPTKTNYEQCVKGYVRGEWENARYTRDKATGFATEMLHIPQIMLNGFEGTRYQYCGYSPFCGLPIVDYLHLWRINPTVELLSKAQMFNFLSKEVCNFLKEHPQFGRFLAKHRDQIVRERWSVFRCKKEYSKQDPVFLAEFKRARREEMERRREARRIAEERRLAQLRKSIERDEKTWGKKIFALYNKVKQICKKHGAYEVVVPQNAEGLWMEGEAAHNCLSGYCRKVGAREQLIIFLHKNGNACVDIAIDLKSFKILQCLAVCNQKAPDDAWRLARRLAKDAAVLLAA